MLDKSNILYFENCIDRFSARNKTALLDEIYMTKKQMVMEIHKYKISQLEGTDSRWYTYVPDDTKKKKRREIRRPSEKDIIDYLLQFYGLNGITFKELFEKWILYKTTITSSIGTIRRHEQHFNKYFVNEGSSLLNKNISKIRMVDLQMESNRIIKKYDMSAKEWKNVKTILKGMFEYAVLEGMLSENPFSTVKITVRFKQVNKKPASTQVYNTSEYASILAYLDKKYAATSDSVYLAVKLQFYTGMRVGELVALRWENVDIVSKTLHIINMESNIPFKDTEGKWHDSRKVVPHTKTHSDRIIDLLPKALEVIQTLAESHPAMEGYLFTRDGERVTERQVNYVLEKYAERAGKAVKSSHKLRKTYVSRLVRGGVPLDSIRQDLGHQNLSTTLSYIYDANDPSETYKLKSAAI